MFVKKYWNKFISFFEKNKDINNRIYMLTVNIGSLSDRLDAYIKDQNMINIADKDNVIYERNARKEQIKKMEKRLKECTLFHIDEVEKELKKGINLFNYALDKRMISLEMLEKSINKQSKEHAKSYNLVKDNIDFIKEINNKMEEKYDILLKDFREKIDECNHMQQVPQRLASIETRITLLEAK